MKSHLAEYFSTIRRNKGITLAQLARMIGYQNVSKGSRRIDNFEKFGQIHENLLAKLAAALGIDGQTVARLIEEDRQWTEPGDINVPYLRVGRRRIYFNLERGIPSVPTEPQQTEPEEVVTDFGGVRLRSSFEITETTPGELTIDIDGPIFEFPPTEGD